MFQKTDISHDCKEKDVKIYVIQLEIKTSNLTLVSLHRIQSENFNKFLRRLDATLKYLYSQKSEFFIHGNINIDYLKENTSTTKKLILTTNNLTHAVNVVIRIQNYSSTAIDNTFEHSVRFSWYFTSPITNSQSNNGTQYLMIDNIAAAGTRKCKINNETIMQFHFF